MARLRRDLVPSSINRAAGTVPRNIVAYLNPRSHQGKAVPVELEGSVRPLLQQVYHFSCFRLMNFLGCDNVHLKGIRRFGFLYTLLVLIIGFLQRSIMRFKTWRRRRYPLCAARTNVSRYFTCFTNTVNSTRRGRAARWQVSYLPTIISLSPLAPLHSPLLSKLLTKCQPWHPLVLGYLVRITVFCTILSLTPASYNTGNTGQYSL